MSTSWNNFLINQGLELNLELTQVPRSYPEGLYKHVFGLTEKAVLGVSGTDAANFLQGQVTCNLNDITLNRASYGAFCNAKGRVITTFLMIRKQDEFLMLLPAELLETVQKKLQMYILRSKVKLTDLRNRMCLMGLLTPENFSDLKLPSDSLEVYSDEILKIKLPGSQNRWLLVAEENDAEQLWTRLEDNYLFIPQPHSFWHRLDILDAIPWLSKNTTEEYIPQMLNLDKIGGISFNKGCYTGQEIIARTHYLGKNKRELYVAQADFDEIPEQNNNIYDENDQIVGKVLDFSPYEQGCFILAVLQNLVSLSQNLFLKTEKHNKIKVLGL